MQTIGSISKEEGDHLMKYSYLISHSDLINHSELINDSWHPAPLIQVIVPPLPPTTKGEYKSKEQATWL